MTVSSKNVVTYIYFSSFYLKIPENQDKLGFVITLQRLPQCYVARFKLNVLQEQKISKTIVEILTGLSCD